VLVFYWILVLICFFVFRIVLSIIGYLKTTSAMKHMTSYLCRSSILESVISKSVMLHLILLLIVNWKLPTLVSVCFLYLLIIWYCVVFWLLYLSYIFVGDDSLDTRNCLPIGVNNGRFGSLLDSEVAHVKDGGERKSKHAENWAAKAFDEWRVCKGLPIDRSIGDLSEDEDLHPFVEMLFKFFLQVRKMDGSLYPPNS
jgi:hypothetical protein